MENYVAGQLAALGTAVALGAAGGLVYDLLRVLRRRRPGLTHAADAVFGLMCLLGALWALTRVGGGEPQLYLLLGAGAGMLLYLLAAAPLLRPLWEFWADVAGELARLLRLPLDFCRHQAKKLLPEAKKGFHSAAKYAILNTYRWKCFLRPKDDARKGVRRHGKKQEKARQPQPRGGSAGDRGAGGRRRGRIYGSRLPELRSKSQALEAQFLQTEKQNDALRSDLEHQGDQDFIQGLARDDLGLASDGERIFYDVNN